MTFSLKKLKSVLAATVTVAGAAVGFAAVLPAKVAAGIVVIGALAQALTGAINDVDKDGDGRVDGFGG